MVLGLEEPCGYLEKNSGSASDERNRHGPPPVARLHPHRGDGGDAVRTENNSVALT